MEHFIIATTKPTTRRINRPTTKQTTRRINRPTTKPTTTSQNFMTIPTRIVPNRIIKPPTRPTITRPTIIIPTTTTTKKINREVTPVFPFFRQSRGRPIVSSIMKMFFTNTNENNSIYDECVLNKNYQLYILLFLIIIIIIILIKDFTKK